MKRNQREEHPFYGVDTTHGVHVLRNRWVQRSYVEAHSRALAAGLDAAIQATRRAAPRRPARGKGFRIGPEDHRTRMGIEEIDEASEERRMEQRLYLAYGPAGALGRTEIWNQLIAFQIPLYDQRVRNGWGHVDLLALCPEGHPIVIELKKENAQDTPLRTIVEGLANAIAVEENWPALSDEIRQVSQRAASTCAVADTAAPVTVMALAPTEYWHSWQPGGVLGRAVSGAARAEFRRLRGVLEGARFPTQLATFDWPFDGDDPRARLAEVDW